jgi:hypothetical protein
MVVDNVMVERSPGQGPGMAPYAPQMYQIPS